ncbi:alpha-ketoglutarate-dependent dioxygenase AlkB family protein [Microbulbifer sp. 2201CG32-9]|uniref:alpha-ketoglutarate-dependent dioxygenase AlkB family protein n=1 Tax=Microbulbifer sp. 2201CG32-9 TaxID=3232309 RepID=UPI00345BE1CD
MVNENIFTSRALAVAGASESVEWLALEPGRALLIRDWLSPEASSELLRDCRQNLQWDQPKVYLFGRHYPIPRLHAYVGDPGAVYRWSGLALTPQPWSRPLTAVRARLAAAGFDFNSVLVNRYRGGRDSMGWHADNERELGTYPVIATLSLGQLRRLSFRRRDKSRRLALDLPNGSLLFTSGAVQQFWLHQLAKSARQMDERISLTFRKIELSPS